MGVFDKQNDAGEMTGRDGTFPEGAAQYVCELESATVLEGYNGVKTKILFKVLSANGGNLQPGQLGIYMADMEAKGKRMDMIRKELNTWAKALADDSEIAVEKPAYTAILERITAGEGKAAAGTIFVLDTVTSSGENGKVFTNQRPRRVSADQLAAFSA